MFKRVTLLVLFLMLLVPVPAYAGLVGSPVSGMYLYPHGGTISGAALDRSVNNPLTIESNNIASSSTPSGSSSSSNKPGFFAKLLGEFLTFLPNAITEGLGLQSFPELVLNQAPPKVGNISGTLKVWGVFPTDVWDSTIKPLHMAFTGVAWAIVLFIIYGASIQMARAGATSVRRTKAYSMLENWLIGTILLAGNVYLMNVVFAITNTAINGFSNALGSYPDLFGLNFANGGTYSNPLTSIIVAPLISVAILGLNFALNFIYIQRYYVLMVFTILSPLFCVAWFSDKTRGLFDNWWKEMLALAFMPVAHGLFLVMYVKAAQSSASLLAQLFFLILMIPMSDMVRGMLGVKGTGKGLNESLLLGIGLGASVALARGVMGLGQAAIGGMNGATGVAQGAMVGTRTMGAGASAGVVTDSAQGVAQTMSNNEMFRGLQQRVGLGRHIGAQFGKAVGGVGGAVFGAAMGSNMGAMIGAMAGSEFGENQGAGIGGRVALAPETFAASRRKPDNFFSELGGSNIKNPVMQQKMDGAGNPMFAMDKVPLMANGKPVLDAAGAPVMTDSFKLDGDGNKIPVMEQSFTTDASGNRVPMMQPVVGSNLAQTFGRANFAALQAQATSGALAGHVFAQRAGTLNSAANEIARGELPNPALFTPQNGDILETRTTDTGSSVYHIGADNVPQFLYATSETNPFASASTPHVTKERYFTDRDGIMQKKAIFNDFKGTPARSPVPAAILNGYRHHS